MKYIFLITIIFSNFIFALEYSFDDLRKSQKELVLKEFKKLYKERKNIHHNSRHVLKHARSKSLNKNHLSFFQAKGSLYEDSMQTELTNVFLSGDVTCGSDCTKESESLEIEPTIDNPSIPEISDNLETTTLADGNFITSPISETLITKKDSSIRNTVNSPWARK